MSTAISIAASPLGREPWLPSLSWPDNAVSSEAQDVRRASAFVQKNLEGSQALFGPKQLAIEQLESLFRECISENWDGYGAKPLELNALITTLRFVRALPLHVALPEFAPEPDGFVSLDWIRSRTRIFSLSVQAHDRLSYAWIDGTDKGHGVARFDGARIPRRILQGILEITEPA